VSREVQGHRHGSLDSEPGWSPSRGRIPPPLSWWLVLRCIDCGLEVQRVRVGVLDPYPPAAFWLGAADLGLELRDVAEYCAVAATCWSREWASLLGHREVASLERLEPALTFRQVVQVEALEAVRAGDFVEWVDLPDGRSGIRPARAAAPHPGVVLGLAIAGAEPGAPAVLGLPGARSGDEADEAPKSSQDPGAPGYVPGWARPKAPRRPRR
jgi:hypothetical protein